MFFDSVGGQPVFAAPVGRSVGEFLRESRAHGWPSFRDGEVVWAHVRVLPDGEVVSAAGTHLGHNLPDSKGSRYCINAVSIAGRPLATDNVAAALDASLPEAAVHEDGRTRSTTEQGGEQGGDRGGTPPAPVPLTTTRD